MAEEEEEEKDPTIKVPTEEIVPTDSELPAIIYDEQVSEAYIKNNRQLDADIRLKEEIAKGNNDGFAWGLGAATELGLGFGGSLAYARWAQGGIGVLRGIKGASHLATIGGPVGWGAKAATHTAANMGIWALSNTLGQTVRTSLSDNTKFSAGELFAASVFGGFAGPSSKAGLFISGKVSKVGAGAVSKIDDIVFKIGGESATNSQLFKGAIKVAEIGGKGATRFVGGGSFAVGETALRQELQLILGERESRDKTEWMYAMGLGGILNVAVRGGADLFSGSKVQQKLVESFRDTFAGRILMRRAIKGGIERLDKEISKHEKIIKELEKDPRAHPNADKPNWNDIDKISEQSMRIAQVKEAKFLLKDFQKGVHADSIKMGDKIPPIKDAKKIGAGEEGSVLEREIADEIAELKFDFQKQNKYFAEEVIRQDKVKKALEKEGKDAPTEAVEINDLHRIRQRSREISDYLEEESDAISSRYLRIRKGEEEGSALETLKNYIKNLENQLTLNTQVQDRLDYDWFKSGWAKQERNKGKNFDADMKGVEISRNSLLHNTGIVDRIKAYKEYIKYGEEFSGLGALITGSKLTTGSRTKATPLVEAHKKRINEDLSKIETKLAEDLSPDAAVSPFTSAEIKTKAQKDTKLLKNLLKDLERSKKHAEKFDEIKTKLDNKLGVSMEEFNALSKKQREELIKERAANVNKTPKKFKAEIEALQKSALKSSTKLEMDAIRREEAEFLRSVKRSYEDGMDANWLSKEGVKRGIRWGLYANKLSYIAQLASLSPSVATGVYSVAYRSLGRPLSRFLAENKLLTGSSTLTKKSTRQAWVLAASDALAPLTMLKEVVSAPRSAWKSWKALNSYTRGGTLESGYADSAKLGQSTKKEKISALITQGDSQERAIIGRKNLSKHLKQLGETGVAGAEQTVLLNVRNLTAIDDVFFRLLVRQEVEAKASALAIEGNPMQSAKDFKRFMQERKKIINELLPKDADGIRRLKMGHKTEELWGNINEDIMWSSVHKDYTHADSIKDAEKLLGWWTQVKKQKRFGFGLEAGELAASPYTAIGLRTYMLSLKYTAAPLRVLPLGEGAIAELGGKFGFGQTTGNNPYMPRIKEVSKQINNNNAMLRVKKYKNTLGDDEPIPPQRLQKIREQNVELKERRKNLETQRVEYNMNEYQRALATAGLWAVGSTLGSLGIYHGTNIWKTQKQRDHDKAAGIDPHSIETPWGPVGKTQSAGAHMSVVNMGASIATWEKLKDEGNLKEDQTWPRMIIAAMFKAPYYDSPFNQVGRTVRKAWNSDNGFDKNFWASVIGGAVNPTPAEIRNFNKIYRGDGYVKDLKGGTFLERALYQKWGTGLPERAFDVLGRTIKEKENNLSKALRYPPQNDNIQLGAEARAWERVSLDDTTGILPTRFLYDDNFVLDEKCRDWRAKNGHSFRTIFAERLREELQDDVNALIAEIGEETFRIEGEDDWEEGVMIRGRTSYTALRNRINNAYSNVRESFEDDIHNNEEYLNNYISKDNKKFLDYIQDKLSNEEGADDAPTKSAAKILKWNPYRN